MFSKIQLRFKLALCLSIFLTVGVFVLLQKYAVPETVGKAELSIIKTPMSLPLTFIKNQGQADDRVAQYIQAPGKNIYFTQDGYTLSLNNSKGKNTKIHNITVELVGGRAERIESSQPSPAIVSYFKGNQDSWKTGIPTADEISYVRPWPGIDIAYDGSHGNLETIYAVRPQADPAQIKLRYSGQDAIKIDGEGNLLYETSIGEIKETAPIAWQTTNGVRVPIRSIFRLIDENTIGFDVDEYDHTLDLVIDPTLTIASYLGGSVDEKGNGIAVDSSGNIYVTGITESSEATFPVSIGPDTTFNGGGFDAFVAKLNPSGTSIIYAGYIGGSGTDGSNAIAVDASGNAYIAGDTRLNLWFSSRCRAGHHEEWRI